MLLAEGIYVKLLSNNSCHVPYPNIIRSHKTARYNRGRIRTQPEEETSTWTGTWVGISNQVIFFSLFPLPRLLPRPIRRPLFLFFHRSPIIRTLPSPSIWLRSGSRNPPEREKSEARDEVWEGFPEPPGGDVAGVEGQVPRLQGPQEAHQAPPPTAAARRGPAGRAASGRRSAAGRRPRGVVRRHPERGAREVQRLLRRQGGGFRDPVAGDAAGNSFYSSLCRFLSFCHDCSSSIISILMDGEASEMP